MFLRMIKGALMRQWKKMIMIALTIALGASLATAMINVVLDVEDKVNQELKAYGANITVVPKAASVMNNLYEIEEEGGGEGAYLLESELGNIKTIFWAFNIVDYAPFITTEAVLEDGSNVQVTGTWFNHHMELPTGEQLDAGLNSLRSWWDITSGRWIDEQTNDKSVAMVGSSLAKKEGISVNDEITLKGTASDVTVKVVGIYDAGGEEDDYIYVPVDIAQFLGGLDGKIDSIEVSALTTPDNELAQKAAKDPGSLSVSQYETWYCTAYVSSICYQIEEVITDSVASAVRQVASSEGTILEKTQLLMILITILSMIGAALGICNLVTASVMERSQEIGLLKAIGAKDRSITGVVMTEIAITALVGFAAGYFMGFGFAQLIGQSVFGSAVEMDPRVIPVVAGLIALVTIAGSLPAIRTVLKLRPAEVLHGGH